MQAIVLLLGISPAIGQGEPDRLELLAPHAAGVALAEVVGLSEVDERTSDGPLSIKVELRLIRSSGEVADELWITKESGGHLPPPGSPPEGPSGPLEPDSLEMGEEYWLAFASRYERIEEYPQGIIDFWPAGDPDVAQVLDEAIRADRFQWRPQFDPAIGLTHGSLIDAEQQRWRIRVEREGAVLWERVIPGLPTGRYYSEGFWDEGYNGFPSELPPCGKILIAETAQTLGARNEFDLPAGSYFVCTGFDPESGERLAAWVSRPQPGQVDLVHREYDPETGGLRREDRFDWMESGGEAVGAKDERWLRKTSRTFDPRTGRVTEEIVFRYEEGRAAGDHWVRIEP